jgi:hypothetical protein
MLPRAWRKRSRLPERVSDLLTRAISEIRVRLMRKRRAGYRALFAPAVDAAGRTHFTPAQMAVIGDLRRFCHADYPTFDPDPRVHALKEGRREVWLRIEHFLNLSDQQLQSIRESDDDDFQ